MIGVVAAAALVVAAGCGGAAASSANSSRHQHRNQHHHDVHASTANGAPDRVLAGPQGRVGQFVVECAFSHMAADDPIVHPGESGASHLHVFFGNTSTDAHSTLASLDAAATTCDQQLDRAAYWAPALFRDGEPVEPLTSTAYYRAGPDVDPAVVEPHPAGLRMIAGDASAIEPQPKSVVAWTCDTSSVREVLPPACPDGTTLRLIVTFPDCWDGVHLDTGDHVSHVAYSAGGVCASGHPVSIAQLQFSVEYPVRGPTAGLELASGGLITGHADFVNAWDPDKLATEVDHCLRRAKVCGVAD